jgi:hypothetical protein
MSDTAYKHAEHVKLVKFIGDLGYHIAEPPVDISAQEPFQLWFLERLALENDDAVFARHCRIAAGVESKPPFVPKPKRSLQ